MGGDWLPHKRNDLINMAKRWLEILPAKEAEWHIPAGMVPALAALALETEMLRDRALGWEGTRGDAARFRAALAEQAALMRDIHRRVFFIPPLAAADFVNLGLEPPDAARTQHFDVPETVEFVIHLRGIRELVVDFWVQGSSHKAKPLNYNGALIIWGVRDAPPARPDELPGHVMATSTPHTLDFKEADRGKTVWIALAWQNERGRLGQYSAYQSAVVP